MDGYCMLCCVSVFIATLFHCQLTICFVHFEYFVDTSSLQKAYRNAAINLLLQKYYTAILLAYTGPKNVCIPFWQPHTPFHPQNSEHLQLCCAGSSQIRLAHTDVSFPDFSTYRRDSVKDPSVDSETSAATRKAFTYIAVAGTCYLLVVPYCMSVLYDGFVLI